MEFFEGEWNEGPHGFYHGESYKLHTESSSLSANQATFPHPLSALENNALAPWHHQPYRAQASLLLMRAQK